jgi:hypothetical protein
MHGGLSVELHARQDEVLDQLKSADNQRKGPSVPFQVSGTIIRSISTTIFIVSNSCP